MTTNTVQVPPASGRRRMLSGARKMTVANEEVTRESR